MSDALLLPLLPPALRLPPPLPAFPLRPPPGLSPAVLAAITRPSDIGAETSSRIPSTNTPGSVAAVPPVFSVACSLGVDFYDELTDLDWGSWEGSLPESSSLGGDGRPLRGASFMDATSSIRDSRTHCGKNSINFAGTATLSSPSTRGGLAYSGPPKWPCLSPPPAQVFAPNGSN